MKVKSVYFWIVAVCFFSGILLAQKYPVNRGSDLIPGAGGNFTLQSAQGPVSLTDFQGKVVAIYFGYMSCPDICPTALWSLTEAVKLLNEQQQQSFRGLFVSVDFERDSPRAMDIFTRGYNPDFIGLTSTTREEIDKVARQYGVIYEKVALPDSAMGYVVDHTSVIYLVDRDGILRYYVPHGETPTVIAENIQKLLG